MKNNINQSIGIIGGMGPQASVKLLEVLINVCTKDFGAKSDSDFPEVILNSVPVPNFTSNKNEIKTVRNILMKRVKKLENFKPSCFGIVCNTAHVMFEDLQQITNVPFVSIIDEVTKKVVESDIERVGLLGTPVTIDSGLYQDALGKQRIEVIIPSKKDRKFVETVIFNVLAGKANEKDELRLATVAGLLKEKGAQGIILGCTELPLIFPKDFPAPVFDSIEILARALLQKFYETKNKNDIIQL